MTDIQYEYIYSDCIAHQVIKNGIYIKDTLSDLPNGLNIFTLPVTTSLINCNMNITNIFEYFPLAKQNIVSIKTKHNLRSLKPNKKQIMSNNNNVSNFMNQITLIMMIRESEKTKSKKSVNIKLFDNNSIQITGLKSIFQCNYTINKIISLLRGKYAIPVNKDTLKLAKKIDKDTKFIKIRFIDSDDIYISDIKISTINLTFLYNDKINQTQFYYKMKELKLKNLLPDSMNISFQADIISFISVWLKHNNTNIKLFIFESGKISIMACKTRDDILYAYNFIQEFLINYRQDIVKKDVLEIVMNDELFSKHLVLEKSI